MTPSDALAEITAQADDVRAAGAKAYHKADRIYLGVPNPVLNDMTTAWRKALDVPARIELADGLWKTNIFEARLAAAKLLTQARIRPDDDVWTLIASWTPHFDSWAIADHACMAGQKRLIADPSRLDQVETWTTSEHMWTRRAALVITLPWTKQNPQNRKTSQHGTVFWAGLRLMSPTGRGSFKKQLHGGCGICPNTTPRGLLRSLKNTANSLSHLP